MLKALFIPLLLIVVGAGWLMASLGYLPDGVNWLWVGVLALSGVGVLISGWNRFSAVLGPMLLLGAVLSTLRQMSLLSLEVELPILVIALGSLLLFVRIARLPLPAWYTPPPTSK